MILDKIKNFFSAIWQYIVLAGVATIGFLLWLLSIKNKQLSADEAKIALTQTQKQADLLEADIKERMADVNANEQQKAQLQQALDQLNKKRDTLSDPRTTDQDKEDFWNKND